MEGLMEHLTEDSNDAQLSLYKLQKSTREKCHEWPKMSFWLFVNKFLQHKKTYYNTKIFELHMY